MSDTLLVRRIAEGEPAAMMIYEGLTLREISERTEISLIAAKTRTLLAMKRLRGALQGEIERLL